MAAESAGWVVVEEAAADDGRSLPERLSTLTAADVDAWLVVGGFDDARPEQALEAAALVAAARRGGRTPVIWAGSAALSEEVSACFEPGVVTTIANPRPDAATEDVEPLRHYLEERADADVLAVGEAAGYQGMRWSGIAFTSEFDLMRWGEPYRRSSRRARPWKEPSGTIVHGVLNELDAEHRVILWNTVPTHPHLSDRPLSNRRPLHVASVLDLSQECQQQTIELFRPLQHHEVPGSSDLHELRNRHCEAACRALRQISLPRRFIY